MTGKEIPNRVTKEEVCRKREGRRHYRRDVVNEESYEVPKGLSSLRRDDDRKVTVTGCVYISYIPKNFFYLLFYLLVILRIRLF